MNRFLEQKPTCSLLKLQKKLNNIFVSRRDRGEQLQPIYRQLMLVEKELSKRNAFWN